MWKKALTGILPEEMRTVVVIISIISSSPLLIILFIGAAFGGLTVAAPLATEEQYESYKQIVQKASQDYGFELSWQEVMALHAGIVDQDFTKVHESHIPAIASLFVGEEKITYTKRFEVPVYKDGTPSPEVTCETTEVEVDETKEIDMYKTSYIVCTDIQLIKYELFDLCQKLVEEGYITDEKSTLIQILAENMKSQEFANYTAA